jgi:hypothetical protein
MAERDDVQKTTIITAPIRVQQRGQEMRLVFDAEDELPTGHNGLVRLLARAHTIRRRLFEERLNIGELAQAEKLIPSYVTRLVRLTFLAPDITASILSGRHDPDLTVSRLMADTRFPLDWSDQRRSFASACMALGVFIHRPDSIYDDRPAERYQFPSPVSRSGAGLPSRLLKKSLASPGQA